MIDWASGWFPCSYDSEKLNSGLIASLLPTGEIEWITHKKTIVEHSETINLWRYDLGARPSPALLDEISDSLENALSVLKSAIAAEKKNA